MRSQGSQGEPWTAKGNQGHLKSSWRQGAASYFLVGVGSGVELVVGYVSKNAPICTHIQEQFQLQYKPILRPYSQIQRAGNGNQQNEFKNNLSRLDQKTTLARRSQEI